MHVTVAADWVRGTVVAGEIFTKTREGPGELGGSRDVQPASRDASTEASTVPAEAFKTYVEPELAILYRVALTLTGAPADAEDLVQETVSGRSARSTGSTVGTRVHGC